MQGFLNKTYPFDLSIRRRILFATWGAIGFFLFILFFQPFGIRQPDFNNYILLIAGFSGISFIIYCLVHIPIPWNRITLRLGQYNLNYMLVFELLIWILNTVAFSFYLRYVAKVNLSIFLVTRIAIITLFQVIINMMIYELYDLRLKLSQAPETPKSAYSPGINKDHEKLITFHSSTGSEKLKIRAEDLILAKAAENYVEFHISEGNNISRKLLRSTLRSVEENLREQPSFIRCHRNCIVNISYVSKLRRTAGGTSLVLIGYDEEPSVSRQYLLQVKNALNDD